MGLDLIFRTEITPTDFLICRGIYLFSVYQILLIRRGDLRSTAVLDNFSANFARRLIRPFVLLIQRFNKQLKLFVKYLIEA